MRMAMTMMVTMMVVMMMMVRRRGTMMTRMMVMAVMSVCLFLQPLNHSAPAPWSDDVGTKH